MYYPILRGKLNELLALRELAELAVDKKFCPVIEPVKASISALVRTVKELNEQEIIPFIICNPKVGDFENSSPELLKLLLGEKSLEFVPVFFVVDTFSEIQDSISEYNILEYAMFAKDGLNADIIDASRNAVATFVETKTPPNLIKKIHNPIIYECCFKKERRNADYKSEDSFSSLHTFYKENEAIGFGDYTILSDEYSESGGPAYVVTIHMTYINPQKFNEAFVKHYSSTTDSDVQSNTGEKFLEAVKLFLTDKNEKSVPFENTLGALGFENLYNKEHFPGLGQAKKLAIMHHIETINSYLITDGDNN